MAQIVSDAVNLTASQKEDAKKNLKKKRDKYREKVRGRFMFFEVPGGALSFVHREFKGDPIERYYFKDGGVYEIPLGVARHLNMNGWYPEYGYVPHEKGIQESPNPVFGQFASKITRKVHRYGFQSLEFLDVDDLPTVSSQVVTVETVQV